MKENIRTYQAPGIIRIQLDMEISLILLSNAPEGPGEGGASAVNSNPVFENYLTDQSAIKV